MSLLELTQIGVVTIAALSLLGGIFKMMNQKQSNLASVALSLVGPLQNRVAVLEAETAKLWRRVRDLEAENVRLWEWGRLNFARIVEMGGEPHLLKLADGTTEIQKYN